MRLFELAYCCRLYAQVTAYDASLAPLLSIGPLDPYNGSHRAALFTWLNAWGCRQFAKDQHASHASPSLETWARSWLDQLPRRGVQLTDLSSTDLSVCAAAYDGLRVSTASIRSLAGGQAVVTFGATGAAKTLFALRPEVFPPWDDPIRVKLGYSIDLASFRLYLEATTDALRQLSSEAHMSVAGLPALVGRPLSTPPKLIDEYNWVTMTRGCTPPTAGEVGRWATWARE